MVDITLTEVNLLAELPLFLNRQVNKGYAFLTATAFMFLSTHITLDEQKVTGFIGAVHMCVA